MPSVADSVVEMVQWVFPQYAGAPGQIHGGRMMQWITEAGTMAASRVARRMVVLGAMDDIDFLAPANAHEAALHEEARARRGERLLRLHDRRARAADASTGDDEGMRWRFESV